MFTRIGSALFLLWVLTAPAAGAPPWPDKRQGDPFRLAEPPSVSISNNLVRALSGPAGRFVIGTTGGDPNTPNDNDKRLTFGYPNTTGTSVTTLRIGNGLATRDYRLGTTEWDNRTGIAPSSPPSSDGTTLRTIWQQDGIRVEERLFFAQNSDTGRLDTTAIEYVVQNTNPSTREVGLRIMLDVMIGQNDGAPYFIAGTGQVTQEADWRGAGVPDYWIAYESRTFAADSLKGRGQLGGGDATRPDRFVIAHWGDDLCGSAGLFESAWDYAPNAGFSAMCDSAVALYYNPARLDPGQVRTYRTYYGIARAGDPAQIELTGLEVTQAIQNWENDVTLIQDKTAYLRAHVSSTSGNVDHVQAKVIGTRIGSGGSRTLLGEHIADNLGGEISVLQNPQPQRRNLNDSFLFRLPPSWLNGAVELEVQGVNKPLACKDHAGADDDCKVQVSFEAAPRLDVTFVGIAYDEGGKTHKPTPNMYFQLADLLKETYPTASIDWDYTERTYKTRPALETVNADLAWQRVLDLCWTILGQGCKRIYYGVLVNPDGGITGGGLAAGIPSWVASGYFPMTVTYTSTTTPLIHAHELGHVLGRSHAEFCDARAGPPYPQDYQPYPYPNGRISRLDAGDDLRYYGFGILSKTIHEPADRGDLMSYCAPLWVSDWTYEGILGKLRDRIGGGTARLATSPHEQTYRLVGGRIAFAADTGRLDPIYSLASSILAAPPATGSYTIRIEDANGTSLAQYAFDPDRSSEPGEDGAWRGSFNLLLPDHAVARRVVLLHGGHVLDARVASAHPPSVALIYPNGGEQLTGTTATVQWLAADDDGDPLTYAVQYSADAGTTWQTLVSGWITSSYDLALGALAGTYNGLIRVIASDGFHTAQSQSAAAFTVTRRPPLVNIQTARLSRLYVGNQTLILDGSAYDPEDRQLQDFALTWSSDLSGPLGSGKTLVLNGVALAEGTHTITLTALDSDGQISRASVVVPLFRERPSLPSSLALAPQRLSFLAPQDGLPTDWQAFSIRNEGDGALAWTASADQNWLRLSSLAGTAPTDALVAVDPTGLPAGNHVGHITVNAVAQNSPAVIEINLFVRPAAREVVYLPLALRDDNATPAPSWRQGAGIVGRTVYDLGAASAACATLYAGTDMGVFRSRDGGEHWAFLPAASAVMTATFASFDGATRPTADLTPAVAVCPTNPDLVYLTRWGGGMFRSVDGGNHWEPRNSGLSDAWLYDLAVDPSDCDIVYAGGNSGGIFKTTDAGGSWQMQNQGLGNLNVRVVAIGRGAPARLYAGTVAGVYRSDNGAASWTSTGALPSGTVRAIGLTFDNPDSVNVGLEGAGVYESANAGATWRPVNSGLPHLQARALAVTPTTPAWFFVGLEDGGGVYRRCEGANAWDAINAGLTSQTVKTLWRAASCNRLHAGTTDGAWYLAH